MMMKPFLRNCSFRTAVPRSSISYSNEIFTQYSRPPLAKIVATIGPVSEDAENMKKVVTAGMRVMRMNFSHATVEEAELRMKNLKAAPGIDKCGELNNFRAILLDTKGPEIRTGGLQACHDTGDVKAKIWLKTGDDIMLTHDTKWLDSGDASTLYVTYPSLETTVSPGNVILLDDGAVKLIVKSVSADGVSCSIENDGEIGARRGVNLPGVEVDLPPMSDKDKVDIRYGVSNDIDFVAASFVRKADDVEQIRAYIKECHDEFFPASHPVPLIISKIESTEALENLDDLVDVSDGIMVARGDLGVEIDIEEVAIWQKEMVRMCNEAGKPVIVATQMLESMQKNPRPTRAEVADVTNAILDGADAVMLSGESANGKYPVESVSMMRSIIDKTERYIEDGSHEPDIELENTPDRIESIASGIVSASLAKEISCIVVAGIENGDFVRRVAKFRPNVPVFAVCSCPKVARQLTIHRGVHPTIGSSQSSKEMTETAMQYGFCAPGEDVIVMTEDEAIHLVTA